MGNRKGNLLGPCLLYQRGGGGGNCHCVPWFPEKRKKKKSWCRRPPKRQFWLFFLLPSSSERERERGKRRKRRKRKVENRQFSCQPGWGGWNPKLWRPQFRTNVCGGKQKWVLAAAIYFSDFKWETAFDRLTEGFLSIIIFPNMGENPAGQEFLTEKCLFFLIFLTYGETQRGIFYGLFIFPDTEICSFCLFFLRVTGGVEPLDLPPTTSRKIFSLMSDD